MNALKTRGSDKAAALDRSVAASGPASVSRAAMTPAGALARHVEWLEFALAAARSEETWRSGRLEKATKKSRDKRTVRLTEVRAEIVELSALVEAIRGLRTRQARVTRGAAKPRSTSPRKRRTTRPAAASAAAATATPAAAASESATSVEGPAQAAAPKRRRATTARVTKPRPTTTGRATRQRAAASGKRTASITTPAKKAPTTRRRRAAGPTPDGPA